MRLLLPLGLLCMAFAPGPVVTTAAPAPGVHQYFVRGPDNKVCILMNATISFTIDYVKADNDTSSVNFTMPDSSGVKVTGDCAAAENRQEMNLAWRPEGASKDWSVDMIFTKNSQEYSVSEVVVHYTVETPVFENPKETGDKVARAVNQTLFGASVSNHFLCRSNQSVEVNNDVFMNTTDLAIQAFRDDTNTQFSGSAQQCAADAETNNIVPIAVGAALAALVVIVLIAYLISRNRNKGGYESV